MPLSGSNDTLWKKSCCLRSIKFRFLITRQSRCSMTLTCFNGDVSLDVTVVKNYTCIVRLQDENSLRFFGETCYLQVKPILYDRKQF